VATLERLVFLKQADVIAQATQIAEQTPTTVAVIVVVAPVFVALDISFDAVDKHFTTDHRSRAP
jgi:hypothetical protein